MTENRPFVGIALLGLPTDVMSSHMKGPALAPARIREVMFDGSSNLCSETGLDLEGHPAFRDAGDLILNDDAGMIDQVEEGVSRLLVQGERVLSLGGDHAVTFPIMRAYGRHFKDLTILHFDAHPDLYDHYEGNQYSHACPFARIMEEGLAKRLVQVGIRTLNDHQRTQARRFGVEIHEMRHFDPLLQLNLEGPVYVTLDLDALDPAYAPGVSHQEPGGLSTRDVLRIIHQVKGPIVGADVVELNPLRDRDHMTARVAAKFTRELAAAMITSLPGKP